MQNISRCAQEKLECSPDHEDVDDGRVHVRVDACSGTPDKMGNARTDTNDDTSYHFKMQGTYVHNVDILSLRYAFRLCIQSSFRRGDGSRSRAATHPSLIGQCTHTIGNSTDPATAVPAASKLPHLCQLCTCSRSTGFGIGRCAHPMESHALNPGEIQWKPSTM